MDTTHPSFRELIMKIDRIYCIHWKLNGILEHNPTEDVFIFSLCMTKDELNPPGATII